MKAKRKGLIGTRSLKGRLFILTNLTIIFVIGVCVLLNSLVFEQYYLSNKTDILFNQLSDIERVLNDDDLNGDDMYLEIERLCVTSNIQAMILNTDGHMIYSSLPENSFRLTQSPGVKVDVQDDTISVRIPAKNGEWKNRRILKQGDNFVLSSAYIKSLGTHFIELFSVTDGNYVVFIQSSMAPIHESVKFSNRFLISVGILVGLLSSIVVMLVGSSLVKPIRKLSDIAKRMARMDFSQRYNGTTYDEVEILGQSMNTMSENLEKSIMELKSANLQLLADIDKKEKIDRQRTEFMSNVSHELKTPIALIEAYAEGLNEMELDDESRAYYCDVILDETKKMNVLIKKLMSLMRIESGAERLDVSRFNITEQISEILKQKAILLEQNGITATLDTTEDIYVWADDFLIEEVFLNYLTNAIKYCSGDKTVKINIEKNDEMVRVNVFNTGAPIDGEVLENMWKSFYMADKARNRENGSQGLGLSIVAAIIKAHNHKYGAYNTDDGVVFYFELDGDHQQ